MGAGAGIAATAVSVGGAGPGVLVRQGTWGGDAQR